jgi:para-nitrobenzyl esterase
VRSRSRLVAIFGCGYVLFALAAWGSEPIAPIVDIESGKVAGEVSGDIEIFRGIPYALPPVEALRWRAPQKALRWGGVRETKSFGASCPQGFAEGVGDIRQIGGAPEPTSEDCLTLNVWAPTGAKHAPVMVWFHGGASKIGSGSLPYYDGASFAKDGVVLVTVNFRLGALGLFAYPGLVEEAARRGEPSGNYALMDQIAALAWVKRNIAAFGGDPGNVTIFGESSGGISVFCLLAAPSARGLFQRAIVESGGGWFGPPAGRADAEKRGKEIAKAAGAPENATLAQLRLLPASALMRVEGESASVPDDRLMSESITTAIASGRVASVPLIIGVNDGEDSLIDRAISKASAMIDDDKLAKLRAIYGMNFDRETAARLQFRDQLATAPARWVAARWQAPAYLYRFEHVSESYRPERKRAHHGAEIFYVFKTLGREPDRASVPTRADEDLSAEIHARWVAFAKTGVPGAARYAAWPAYSPADQWMVFGQEHTSVKTHVLKPQLDWYERQTWPLILLFRAREAIARFFRWL